MKVTALKQVHYDPSVFTSVETVDEAVRIILTPEAGMTSVHRWKTEAPYLMTLIETHIAKNGTVLDYGCGIGRLSKPLIEKHDCSVIGVDISPNMRALASSCVGSDRFFALHPGMLSVLPSCFATAAIAIWTLQHCLKPSDDIANIYRALADGAPLFIVNNVRRVVPVDDGQWADDAIDIHGLILGSGFVLIERGELEGDDIAPGTLRDNTFWAAYRKS
jgi:SAM-dependent methyltransferase